MPDDKRLEAIRAMASGFGGPGPQQPQAPQSSGGSRRFQTDFSPEQWEQYKATLPPVLRGGQAEEHLRKQGIPSDFIQSQAQIGESPDQNRSPASIGGSPEEEQQRQAQIQALNKIRGQ
jgi:hypothetical protein